MTEQTEERPRLPKLPPLEPIGVTINGEFLTTMGQLIDGFGRAVIRDIEALLESSAPSSEQWFESWAGLSVGYVRRGERWLLAQRWHFAEREDPTEPEPLDPGLVIEHLTPILALLLPVPVSRNVLTNLKERAGLS